MKVIKPSPQENKTTIQIDKSLREKLIQLGQKGESYNDIIERILANPELVVRERKETFQVEPVSAQMQIGSNAFITRYPRITISIKEDPINLEVSYNKPLDISDKFYQMDLRIDRVIFDNEVYSTKEFFGVLHKDMVYSLDFVYYYLRSVLEVLRIEFKRYGYLFKEYKDFFEISRWRTYIINAKISQEILSHDVESVLSDLKNEQTNEELKKDVDNSVNANIRKYAVRRI